MSKDKAHRSMLMALAILLSAAFAAPCALAQVYFSVNSTLDQPDDLTIPGKCHTAAGTCTLRAAVMQANRSAVDANIHLPAGTYVLTIPPMGADGDENGDLDLTTPAGGDPRTYITGDGPNTTIIDANQLDRVLHVHPNRTVILVNVTMRNGIARSGLLFGGGVYNEGVLILYNVAITGNQSAAGGGIANVGNLAVAQTTTITQNSAAYEGGGIFSEGQLEVAEFTFSHNYAPSGGGIMNRSGTAYVSYSTISGNNAGADGGGIFNKTNLSLVNSTLSQNSANNNGGGIFNGGGVANVYSTTIVFNGADADADANGGSAGGIFNDDGADAVFNLRNTLVAGNYVHNAPVYDDCTGTLNSFGVNLFWRVVGCTVNAVTGIWTTLNALSTIGPLQNNGGPTLTHALLPNSNAIDHGDLALGCIDGYRALPTDQRGAPRVVGYSCDVGSFEFSLAPTTAAAIEYYHAAFDHYFITAKADEITKLDNGTFAGWARTGQSFTVYLNADAGLFPVCRFFSTSFPPKSSHFYTPDASECANVKASRDWQWEGIVMYVINADGGGNCPAGAKPIYRMYNNGQGAAPNHRYTTSLAIRSQMLAQGWIPEGYGPVGVIMCAPL